MRLATLQELACLLLTPQQTSASKGTIPKANHQLGLPRSHALAARQNFESPQPHSRVNFPRLTAGKLKGSSAASGT